ncbi:serum response factor-binding protein 1 isoform X2 [Heteronotia binoei]|uniref:serum response factor-binding protein 1 isoform X2 n=1 Tax=Heteronotia binoei TaxID=13085 RepID=UPI00292D0778|nr:serum response factor-binding protein 1 isoform X2 [Heteronotia binoei]
MAQVLNLNNEVVKMRRDVKKARVLTIRKLTRHISKLKAKKGTEDAILKNHKRAQRLLEEIHAMKPDSTATDRAIARLTTHPLLKTKIAVIKAAVKAFKDSRKKPARTISLEKHKSEEQLTKQPEVTQHSSNSECNQMFKQGRIEVREKSDTDKRKKQICKKEKQKTVDSEKKWASVDSTLQAFKHHKLVSKSQLEMMVCPERKKCLGDLLNGAEDESDSGASNTEEDAAEKYFDDSTEERFYNQSSGSDESDDNDDFFIGKVKRMKKKGAADLSSLAKDKNKTIIKEKGSQTDTVQDPDIQGSYPRAKARKLESVFYTSLSNLKQKPKNVKRTPIDHLSKNKMMVFERKCPEKQLPKCAGTKQELKRKQSAQPLHPSWEASRKRREQTSQITVFQGKKIIFED